MLGIQHSNWGVVNAIRQGKQIIEQLERKSKNVLFIGKDDQLCKNSTESTNFWY